MAGYAFCMTRQNHSRTFRFYSDSKAFVTSELDFPCHPDKAIMKEKALPNDSATLLIHCPDMKGVVSSVTDFIFKNNGNILYLDQHVDPVKDVFFMRVEWDLSRFLITREKIAEFFRGLIGDWFNMKWTLHFSGEVPRMAIFVSKLPHCLYDILARYKSGELKVDIPLIISNHMDLKSVADQFGMPFYHFEITAENKRRQENVQLSLMREHRVSFVVLARYMQILTKEFVDQYTNRIINIHHSFLPAFPGAKPYHSAYDRGVKVIGATSHYVTSELDAGPIIEQDVTRVSHTDSVEDLIRKGRDLEKLVLSRAIWSHVERKTLVYDNRTVIFT
jgi:formyltetrahydrofolate deformylase